MVAAAAGTARLIIEERNRSVPYRLILIILLILPLHHLQAEPTQDERFKALQDIMPGKTLTPDLLVQIAVLYSDQVQQIGNALVSRDSARLRVEAGFDTRLEASASHIDDQLSTSGGFAPISNKIQAYSLGAGRLFSTGTSLDARLGYTSSEQEYAASPFSASLPGETDELKLEMNLRQSLWKNQFGRGTGLRLQAAEQGGKATTHSVEEQMHGFVLETIRSYYDAWNAREAVQAAEKRRASQDRLLAIVNRQNSLGTVELPDVLQVRASRQSAVDAVSDARSTFQQIWRSLVVSLKLPSILLELDPGRIPMAMDDRLADARQICAMEESAIRRLETPATRALQARAAAAGANLEAAVDEGRADVYAMAGLQSNSHNDQFTGSFSETGRIKNPRLQLTVGVSMNLGGSAATAAAAEALQGRRDAELQLSQTRDGRVTNWLNQCRNLRRMEGLVRSLEQVHQLNERRAVLEEKRFRLGRKDAFSVLQANDMATNSGLNLNRTRAQLRILAWSLKKLRGDMKEYLEELRQRPAPGQDQREQTH